MLGEHGVDLPEPMQLNQENRRHGSQGHGRKQDVELQVTRNEQTGRRHRQEAKAQNQEGTPRSGPGDEEAGADADCDY